jgi:hypothetical protein
VAVPTTVDFRLRFQGYQEFQSLPPAVIQAGITAAAAQFNAAVWGEQHTEGVCQLAAHLIVLDNRAHCCKLIKDTDTVFLANYERMAERLVSGDRVP